MVFGGDARCRGAQERARSAPAATLLSRQGVCVPRLRRGGPRPGHHATHSAERGGAAARTDPRSPATVGRRADEQLAQSLSRAAHPLGSQSAQLPGARVPCVRAHRAPTIRLNFETRSKLQRNQIGVCRVAANDSINPLAASAFVRTYERTGGPRRRAATVPASSKLSRQEKPMRTATTRPRALPTLYVAFALGNTEWVLAMTTGVAQPPLRRVLPARALTTLRTELGRAKAHFGLAGTAPVCSCYEAGRDGFWLHRYLVHCGIANRIVDSSSIEVNRRRRRTKTDRLDAAKLVTMLIRAEGGEEKVWSVVNVPTSVEEDR